MAEIVEPLAVVQSFTAVWCGARSRGLGLAVIASPLPVSSAVLGGLRAVDGSAADLAAYYSLGRIPVAYIGYALAGLCIAMGDTDEMIPSVYTLIGGRQLLADDGRPRLFASQRMYDLWREQVLLDVVAMVGAAVLLPVDEREALMRRIRLRWGLRIPALSRAAARAPDQLRAAALAADVEYIWSIQ